MSENIPYIIAENGYYYVAYKEKAPVPEIVVSSKGVANGLSEEYNDGWDFGPDSYLPTSTSAIPYTQTVGIQEAFDYAISVGNISSGLGGNYLIMPDIYIMAGNYNIYNPIKITGASPAPAGIGFMRVICSPNSMFSSYIDNDYTITISPTNTTNMGLIWEGGTYDDIDTGLGFLNWDFGRGNWSGSAWAIFYGLNWNENNSNGNALFLRGLNSVQVFGQMGSSVTGADWHIDALNYIEWHGTFGSFSNADSMHLTLQSYNINVDGATGITLNPDVINIEEVKLNIIGTLDYTATIKILPSASGHVINLVSVLNSSYVQLDIQNRITNVFLSNISGSNSTSLLPLLVNSNPSTTSGHIDYLTAISVITTQNNQPFYNSDGLTITYSNISQLNNGNTHYGLNWIDLPVNAPSTPSIPASGTAQQNTNPYPVKVYVNGGALTELQITIGGTAYTVYSNSTASAVYEGFTLPVGASITLTYTTAPTWSWVPE